MPTEAAVEPITPTSDQAVVRLELGDDIAAPELMVVLYDDRSLLDLQSSPPTVRSLTSAGRDLVVDRVRDTGTFTKSHTIPAVPVNGGFGLFAVTLVVDGAPITVRGTNVTCGSDGAPAKCVDDPETPVMDAPPSVMYSIVSGSVVLNATDQGVDPKASAIVALAKRLLDPVAWLADIAWVGADETIRPYRPALIALAITATGWCEGENPELVTALRWPLAGSLATFAARDSSDPCWSHRTITAADAVLLVDALAAAGSVAEGEPASSTFVLATGSRGVVITLWFRIASDRMP